HRQCEGHACRDRRAVRPAHLHHGDAARHPRGRGRFRGARLPRRHRRGAPREAVPQAGRRRGAGAAQERRSGRETSSPQGEAVSAQEGVQAMMKVTRAALAGLAG
ncbi:MAG: hypothetical protein ACK56F_30385, partial [bacterium]